MARADHQPSSPGPLQFPHDLGRLFQFSQDPSGMVPKQLARLCEGHFTSETIEEPGPEFLLPRADLDGQGRLGNMDHFRGARKALTRGHSEKIAKLTQLHGARC